MNPQTEENAPTIPQNYLQMPYNLHLWLRKEFMSLCGDVQEAMIMRVVEYEIEGDRRVWLRKATELAGQGKDIPEEPEWWITLSHKQIIARLYESVKDEKTLRKKLKSLIEEKKFLLMRDNPDNHYGAPQYTINRALVQDGLNKLPPLPRISDAAKAQVDPLPKTVPPTKNGTPYQSSQEGGTTFGTSPLPKVVPAPYQDRQVPPTKDGTPYKKEKNSKNSHNLGKNEEGVSSVVAMTSPSRGSSSHVQSSQSVVSVVSEDVISTTALISHPDHNFIFLDDPDRPTTIFVQFGDPDDEQGFNHRAHTASEVQWELEARLGYRLKCKSSYEQRSVEGDVTPHPSSVKGVPTNVVSAQEGIISTADSGGDTNQPAWGTSTQEEAEPALQATSQPGEDLSFTGEDDTLNLANSTKINPEIFAQHPVPTVNNATECNETQQSSYSHSPQHDTTEHEVSAGEGLVKLPGVGGYKNVENQVEIRQCEDVTNGAHTGGKKNVYVVPAGASQVEQNPPGGNGLTGNGELTKPGENVHSSQPEVALQAGLGPGETSTVTENDTEQSCVASMDEVKIVTQAALLPVVEAATNPDVMGQNLNVGASVVEKRARNRTPKENAKKTSILTTEERRVYDLYSHLWFVVVPPTINETSKAHCEKLAPHVKTQEDMQSLYEFTRDNCKYFKSKIVHLGNLVNCINEWLQTRPKPVVQLQLVAGDTMDKQKVSALVIKAATMAKTVGHEINVEAGDGSILVQWNTPHFDKPETFTSEAHFLQCFADMQQIWRDLKKKKAVI